MTVKSDILRLKMQFSIPDIYSFADPEPVVLGSVPAPGSYFILCLVILYSILYLNSQPRTYYCIMYKMHASGTGRWQIVNFFFSFDVGYGRTGSDPAVHSTSSVKTYNLKWYQRDQQRRHSTKNRESKGTPPSHCSTEQLIQNSSKVNKKNTHTHAQCPIRNGILGIIYYC